MQLPNNDGTYTNDFLDFTDELAACLPMVARWLHGCEDATRLKWQELLTPVDLAYAKNRLNKMLRDGDKCVTESVHWQTIPSMIRSAWFRDSYVNPDTVLPPKKTLANSDVLFDTYFVRIMAIRKEYQDIPGIWTNAELQAEWRERRLAIQEEYNAALDGKQRKVLTDNAHDLSF